MPTVILRDDDTNALTPVGCLERLYRPFLDRGLPVNLAVIPDVRTDVRMPDGRLEGFLVAKTGTTAPHIPIGENKELVDYLKANRGFHIVQHGCHHDRFEFDMRDGAEARRRIDLGADRLGKAGFDVSRTFVAPYDRFSKPAMREVAGRFEVISTGWFEWRRIPSAWLPSYVLYKARRQAHWRRGRTLLLRHPGCLLSRYRPYEGMLESVQAAVNSSALIVIVTHWWEYFPDGKPDEAFIQILHATADWLARSPDVRVVAFDQLTSAASR